MILRTRHAGNRELRFFVDSRPPGRVTRASSAAGVFVTEDEALGLPALGRAVRLVAGFGAGLGIRVFEGAREQKRERPDSPQAAVLSRPVFGMSSFDWGWDVFSSLETTENAFLLKRKAGDLVVELPPVPPQYVTATVEAGEKVFYVRDQNGSSVRLTADEILHVRGASMDGSPFGVSRIHQHRDPVGAYLAAQRFEGKFYANNARPGVAYVFPQGVSRKQALEWKEDLEADHAGADNAWKPFVAGGGVQVTALPVNMADAQFIETKRLSVEDVGRIMDVEPVLLGSARDESSDRDAVQRFLAFQMRPRLKRVEAALRADLDLFPPGSDLYPEFDVNDLMFSDPLTRAQTEHFQIQDGTLLKDEVRASRGLPPLPDGLGQVPQVVPVGGMANPGADQ